MVNGKRWGRRGQVMEQLLYAGVFMFVIAIIVMVCYFSFGAINSSLQNSTTLTPDAKSVSQSVISRYPGWMDNAILMFMVGLFLMAAISALVIVLHPALSILYFIGLVVITFVMAALSNTYQDLVATSTFHPFIANFPFVNSILTWLPVIVFCFGILCGAVAFKLRSVMMQ